MDDSTTTSTTASSPDYHTVGSGGDTTDHSSSYAYKNEVSLSISNDDQPTLSNAPTPSPRSHTELAMEDVPLTRNGHMNGNSGLDNPGFDTTETPAKTARPLSSFGQNGLNDSNFGKKGTAPTVNGKSDKPLVGKLKRFFRFLSDLTDFSLI